MAIQMLTLFIYLFWILWWRALPQRAKPEVRQRKGIDMVSKFANFTLTILIALQLLGLPLLHIRQVLLLHDLVGFVLFLLGIGVSVKGRIDLGKNWVPGYNYTTSASLTTSGIYQYIRHPIYLGILLVYIGAELVARSYLSVVLLLLIIPIYLQAKKEEKLLHSHFGKQYEQYAKKSKMFIPLVL